MARPLRIQYPAAWCQAMNRGRRGGEIFKKKCLAFIDLLKMFSENKAESRKRYTAFTLTLYKSLVQKRCARSISGHQETLVHFQDLTVC